MKLYMITYDFYKIRKYLIYMQLNENKTERKL